MHDAVPPWLVRKQNGTSRGPPDFRETEMSMSNVACELRLPWTCDLPAAHASRAKPVYKVEWWENGIPDLGIRIIGPAL